MYAVWYLISFGANPQQIFNPQKQCEAVAGSSFVQLNLAVSEESLILCHQTLSCVDIKIKPFWLCILNLLGCFEKLKELKKNSYRICSINCFFMFTFNVHL